MIFHRHMIFLGIDPAVSDMALGFWSEGKPVGAQIVHVVRRKGVVAGDAVVRMIEALEQAVPHEHGIVEGIAMESQQQDGRDVPVANLITLAQIAGAGAKWIREFHPEARMSIPTPKEWKGQLAKHAHQGRLYSDLGWGYKIIGTGKKKYARPITPPPEFQHITPGQWKEVGDALLLGRWMEQQQ